MLKRIFLALVILTSLVIVSTGCDLVSPEPSIGEIKSDLIGETLTQGTLTWHFHALSEFEEVTTSPLTVDISDSVTITETVSPLILELNIDVFESVTITEAVEPLITELNISVFDSVVIISI